MRKLLLTAAAALLLSTQAFAAYFIVLKDGTQYKARQKWTVVNGKATFQLENGQTLQLDPASIDVAKSEEATKYGGGSVLGQELCDRNESPCDRRFRLSIYDVRRTRRSCGADQSRGCHTLENPLALIDAGQCQP